MRHKIILILIVLVLIFLSIIVVHYNFLSKDEIELLSDIISSLGTIFTVYIAILLYDRFGIDRELKLKSLDSVARLIDKFLKTDFMIESKKNGTKSLHFLRFNDKDFFSHSERLRVNLYFHSTAIEALSYFCSSKCDVLLPPEVAKALSGFEISAFQKIEIDESASDYSVISCYAFRDKSSIANGVYAIHSPSQITAGEFICQYKNLKSSIIDWVKNNTFESQKLNIQL